MYAEMINNVRRISISSDINRQNVIGLKHN